MASNLANRSRRTSNLSNDWSGRQTADDNFRKSPGSENCYRDDERLARRYEGTTKSSLCHRQGDATSDHELYNLTEEKTSDEGSITDLEPIDNGHGDVRPTYHQCDSCPKKYDDASREYCCSTCGKSAASHRPPKSGNLIVENPERSEAIGVISQPPVSPTRNQRNPRNYANPVNLSQALIAMRKLERLKELQRRREQSERFYSHEIRRLIGENFFPENTAIVAAAGGKNKDRMATTPTNRPNENAQNGLEHRARGGGFAKELEPQATMTTITRLDCGCVEEKTIRVVKSSMGHVQRCESHRYQERPVSKSISSHPQELSYRSVESPGKIENHTCTDRCTKGKFPNDCGQYRNTNNCGSRDVESWDDHRTLMRNRRSPKNLSPVRTNSPVRKYSDTSSNSLEKTYE